MRKILIADDEVTTRMELEEMLVSLGYEVVGEAETGRRAVDMARQLLPDLILMDIVMPGEMDGISAAEKIKQESDIAIVFITGFGDPEYVERAKQLEPFGYVMKPLDEAELRGVIEISLHNQKIGRELREAKSLLEQKVLKRTEELSKTNEQLKALMNASQETAVLLDLDGTIAATNGFAAERFSIPVEQFIGLKVWEILPEELVKTRKPKIERVIKTGKALRFEDTRDGMIFENTVYPVFDDKGEVIQVAIYAKDITSLMKSIETIHSTEKELEATTLAKEELNTALSVLLRRRDEDRIDLEDRVAFNVQKIVRPQLNDLRRAISPEGRESLLDDLEASLKTIIAPFARDLSSEVFNLTPTEIRVATLVKDGKTNKEIARHLKVSKNTILAHRVNIRTKLEIRGKDIDLRTHLLKFT